MSETKQKYPPKNATMCIVCEDIRIEVSGKLTMVGVYPGGTINFLKRPTKEIPGQVNLAFSCWFRKGYGTFETRFAIIGPTDEKIIDLQLGSQTVEAGKVMVLNLKFQNAVFVTDGEYKIITYLNDRQYEYPLLVTWPNDA